MSGLTRRGLVSAIAIAPAIMATPAGATASTAFDLAEANYRAATLRFNALAPDLEITSPAIFEREEDRFITAVRAVDAVPLATPEEFVRAFLIMTDEGYSVLTDKGCARLVKEAMKLRR